MEKILTAFQYEDAEQGPAAALSAVEEGSPPVTRNEDGAPPVEPGGELTRQTSVHGAGYDALIEQGVPRRMLKRAWVMGGGEMDGAMEFIRANFDQPDDFWGASDDVSTYA